MMAIDMAKLELRPREMQVLRYAAWAGRTVRTGNFLCSDGQRRAAERLIARKFLTKVKAKFSPPVDWLVVKLTKRNWAQLELAEREAG